VRVLSDGLDRSPFKEMRVGLDFPRMRRQDWAGLVSVTAIGASFVALVRRRTRRALAYAGIAVGSDALGRVWSRRNPGPLPHSLRWVLALPHPAGPLAQALEPREGDRILEIGPGLGQQAVQVAKAVGNGRVDVVDIQQEMLDATTQRADRNRLTNIVPALGDASGRLPYEDDAFDAAYLMGVLGEIPDRARALAELHRTLKPGGRLIVGEVIPDPDFVPAGRLRAMAEAAGFRFDRRFGPPFAYHARFVST
jgi:SAM-dependent methyltransferase